MTGSSDPKLCVEESEIGAKTGARAEEAEAEAGAEEEDTTEDSKMTGEMAPEEETAAEEIRRATERRYLRRERRRADLDIEDKESRKRHSLDNAPKRLKIGSGGRENDKDDALPEDEDVGKEVEEIKEDKMEENAGDEKVET